MISTPLLTRRDVAILLNVHTETVKRMGKRGQLNEVKFNRSVRYRPDEVDTLILNATVKRSSPSRTQIPRSVRN